MNQINPDLNETAEKVCGFLGCDSFAGDVDITVAVLNDFGVAQELQVHACVQHEIIVNAVSAAKHITFQHGGGVSNMLDVVNWVRFTLFEQDEATLIRKGYL